MILMKSTDFFSRALQSPLDVYRYAAVGRGRSLLAARPLLTLFLFIIAGIILCASNLHAQGAAFIPTEQNDPYFYPLSSGGKNYPGQWHLWNKAAASGVNAGQDAGLKNAWSAGYTGRGVVIGIVDDGVNGTHEDLKDNYLPELSRNFSRDPVLAAQDQGPVQRADSHGTAVAGVAAARGGNGVGGTGAAPFAGLAGLRIRMGGSLVGDPDASAQDHYDAYLWKSGLNATTLAIEAAPEIHIKNHSYGPEAPFGYETGADRLKDIFKATADNGVVHVFSAGNARNRDNDTKVVSCEDANKDFSITSPYVMAVAALGSDGIYSYYSSYGANVFVTAPSSSYANYLGITTTDRTGADYGYNKYDAVKNPDGDKSETYPYYNYTSTFGGTSSSAPLVSGIMALGKEANPLMSIRMAKHALSLPTVTDKVDAGNGEWILNKGVDVQRNFNPNYGFGLIQADKFVTKITEVAYVTTEKTQDINATKVDQSIPDNDPDGRSVTFTINPALPIESIEVGLKFSHERRGDLQAYLISPDGTESRLFNDTSVTIANKDHQDNEAVTDFDWTFLTNAFWGEQKNGTWTLKMVDVAAENTGTWLQYGLRFHLGKMEIQKNEAIDLGANNIEAESLTMTKYGGAAYKINSGYTFTVRDGLTLKKGKLEVDGTFNLQGAYDSIMDGVLAGTGELMKSGPGDLTINGDASTFTGNTNIAAGRIRIGDDGVLGGTLEIRSGGILSGVGKVGPVVNKGSIEPGNSVGTLTIQGNYAQEATGKMVVEVASETSNDLLKITGGDADLDGTLKTVWQGGAVPRPKTRFGTFLTVDGGKTITGRFSILDTHLTPTLKFIPQYDETDKVYLLTERDYAGTTLLSSLNANQQAVSNMIKTLANDAAGDLDTVLSRIDALTTSSQVAAAFDALSPLSGAAHTGMSHYAAAFQSGNIADRLDDLRAGMQGFSFHGLHIEEDMFRRRDRQPILLASAGGDLRGMIPAGVDPRWGIFARGSIVLGDRKDTTDQKGFNFRNTGVTLGMDYRFSPWAVGGALFGVNDAKSCVNDTGSTVRMEGYTAGLYGSLYGSSLYADGQVSYGWNRYDNARRIVFPGLDRTAHSSPTGNQVSAYGGTGYDFRKGNWTLGPTLSFQYVRLGVNEYTETDAGALNLHVNGKSMESLQGSLGGKVSWIWEGDKVKVIPRLSGSYRHEFAAADQTTFASLAQGSSAFAVSTPAPERNYFAIGTGVTLQWKDHTLVYLHYDAQLGQSDFRAQSVTAGLRFTF